MLHLPQEPGKGGGWTEKMECGCGGSSLQGIFPQTQAFPSSAEAEEHMLTQCPSPRCSKGGAPSPNALLRTRVSAGVVQAELDQHDLAREGLRGSWVGERVMGQSVGKITFKQAYK